MLLPLKVCFTFPHHPIVIGPQAIVVMNSCYRFFSIGLTYVKLIA